MTQARKEFLVWWWTMVTLYIVLSTVGTYVYWDEMSAQKIATGIAILVFVWIIPGALLGRARSPR